MRRLSASTRLPSESSADPKQIAAELLKFLFALLAASCFNPVTAKCDPETKCTSPHRMHAFTPVRCKRDHLDAIDLLKPFLSAFARHGLTGQVPMPWVWQ